ncbi:hypothetical protein mRhiFer1_009776 [Rhinolophus ferrumequinum]|uniref:Uncharacterized protein n=1 Tax=Rhinolophus ferrumequinum TaxID=59479 RepID=A0A7J7ZD66_RHIFE|nr:hypothetical protein mRhiFer1_009776 [Rhinolophus ferrumequinum]
MEGEERGGCSWHCLRALSGEPLHFRPSDSTDSLGAPPQWRVGTPSSPAFPPVLGLGPLRRRLAPTVPAAKVTSSRPFACATSQNTIPPLAHPNPTQLQLPTPNLCSRSALKDALYMRCLSSAKTLQTVSHISQLFPFFLSRHPHRHFLLPPAFTELFGTALDWSQLQSTQLAAEKSTEQGKGAHTSLQKCFGLHFCLIRNDSHPVWWIDCILMIPFFAQFRNLCWDLFFVFVFFFFSF